MWETWIQPLDWEDLLEKGMATHSSILVWEVPWTEEPGRLQSTGLQRVRHQLSDWHFHFHTYIHSLSDYLPIYVIRVLSRVPCALSSIFVKDNERMNCSLFWNGYALIRFFYLTLHIQNVSHCTSHSNSCWVNICPYNVTSLVVVHWNRGGLIQNQPTSGWPETWAFTQNDQQAQSTNIENVDLTHWS